MGVGRTVFVFVTVMVIMVVILLPGVRRPVVLLIDRGQHALRGQEAESGQRGALDELTPGDASVREVAHPVAHVPLAFVHEKNPPSPDEPNHQTLKAMLPAPATNCSAARNAA